MLVRRDGSIDLRVLATRAASYAIVIAVASALGALIAFAGA
jgi:hypothetical protein